jgi:hypothetical protein
MLWGTCQQLENPLLSHTHPPPNHNKNNLHCITKPHCNTDCCKFVSNVMAYAHKLLNKIAIVITFVIWVMEALDYWQCTSKKEVANYAKARQHVVKHHDNALTFPCLCLQCHCIEKCKSDITFRYFMTLVTTQFALKYLSYHFEMKKTLSLSIWKDLWQGIEWQMLSM